MGNVDTSRLLDKRCMNPDENEPQAQDLFPIVRNYNELE